MFIAFGGSVGETDLRSHVIASVHTLLVTLFRLYCTIKEPRLRRVQYSTVYLMSISTSIGSPCVCGVRPERHAAARCPVSPLANSSSGFPNDFCHSSIAQWPLDHKAQAAQPNWNSFPEHLLFFFYFDPGFKKKNKQTNKKKTNAHIQFCQ